MSRKRGKSKIPLVWKKYNLDAAIMARRFLMLEAHTLEECKKLLYGPTGELLASLNRNPPKYLVCLHGPVSQLKGEKGSFVDVDLVLPDKKVIYLGVVLDKDQAISYWKWCLKTYRNYPQVTAILEEKGPFAIMKHKLRCTIPIERDRLTEEVIEEAVRKYLRACASKLASLPIKWLPQKEQLILEAYIWHRACQEAKSQTKEEQRRIFEEDIKKGEYGKAVWFRLEQ